MRELTFIYFYTFTHFTEENNRSEYILDEKKTNKHIKHLPFCPKKRITKEKKQNKISHRRILKKKKLCNGTKVYTTNYEGHLNVTRNESKILLLKKMHNKILEKRKKNHAATTSKKTYKQEKKRIKYRKSVRAKLAKRNTNF